MVNLPDILFDVNKATLKQNALASLRHYRERIVSLARYLSITERASPVPEGFRAELARGEPDAFLEIAVIDHGKGDVDGLRGRHAKSAAPQRSSALRR